jgi:hypothetical protein
MAPLDALSMYPLASLRNEPSPTQDGTRRPLQVDRQSQNGTLDA